MDETGRYVQLISGRRRGVLASLGRGLLRGSSSAYGLAIALRNRYHDAWALPRWLDVPVISVGNLTVGGTGKTPMTLWLCRRLLERGLKPAVLSRGYKASRGGLADELLMISRRCPQAVAVANPDRFEAGRMAIAEYGAQVAILDDGFQHRRLGRDLDIVLIDATRAFGYGHLLPRGLLREPVAGLQRADAVVVTRCDQCAPGALSAIDETVHEINPAAPVAHAVHRPTGFVDLAGKDIAAPAGERIGAFAGIARPESFANTLAGLGVTCAGTAWGPDHHVYTAETVERIAEWAAADGLDALVTTEKDAVKLASLDVDWPVPLAVLRVEIEMRDDGDKMLADLIDTTLREYEQREEIDEQEAASAGPERTSR